VEQAGVDGTSSGTTRRAAEAEEMISRRAFRSLWTSRCSSKAAKVGAMALWPASMS
jgi:hypothetical protein